MRPAVVAAPAARRARLARERERCQQPRQQPPVRRRQRARCRGGAAPRCARRRPRARGRRRHRPPPSSPPSGASTVDSRSAGARPGDAAPVRRLPAEVGGEGPVVAAQVVGVGAQRQPPGPVDAAAIVVPQRRQRLHEALLPLGRDRTARRPQRPAEPDRAGDEVRLRRSRGAPDGHALSRRRPRARPGRRRPGGSRVRCPRGTSAPRPGWPSPARRPASSRRARPAPRSSRWSRRRRGA